MKKKDNKVTTQTKKSGVHLTFYFDSKYSLNNIDIGWVDFVLPPAKISAKLKRLATALKA